MTSPSIDSDFITRLLELTLQIQRIPTPTSHELERSNFVKRRFLELGIKDVTQDSNGNVYARIAGDDSSRPIVVSAHLDTVFEVETDLSHKLTKSKIHAPGIGDNSLAVAGLFGLIWAIQSSGIALPSDLYLVANVAEEGLGNLSGIHAVVKRFEDRPRAYIVLEGMAYGQIYHRGLGVRRYKIDVETKGGHSWVDHGSPSAVHELANLISTLIALELPIDPRTTLNVGLIEGGRSVNSISAAACLSLDLRSTDSAVLAELANQVEKLVFNANREGVLITLKTIGDRPTGEISEEHVLVRIAVEVLKAQGIAPELNIGSTDANVPLSKGYPAVCIGLTDGGGAHTTDEYINLDPLINGMRQLFELIQKIFAEIK